MSRFVDDLLLLAKAESPTSSSSRPCRWATSPRSWSRRPAAIADRDWRLDAVSPRSIVADRQRLTQAVMNLAQNAVAHTGRRRRDRDRRRRRRRRGGDLGPGHRAPGSRRRSSGGSSTASPVAPHSRGRYEGSGLGLAIVRAIAEAHGGRVRVNSRPGEGARFEDLLPIDEEAPERRLGGGGGR